MDITKDIIASHNDQQKFSELECSRRWLAHYNALRQTDYCCLKTNYFQSPVDIYAYPVNEAGRPLRLQLTKSRFSLLSASIKRKKGLYSPEQKADLFLIIDFQEIIPLEKIIAWRTKHLSLLTGSGFKEIWLVGVGDLVVQLWPVLN